MKRNILNSIGFLMIIMALATCKSKKEAITGVAGAEKMEKPAYSKVLVMNNIREKQVDFKTLVLKAKANLQIDDKDNEVSMNIRMKKDEAVWVSATVIAGIEVARALITPDSLKIMNRVEGTYIRKPFSYIHQFTNEQITFKTLQALLIGNSDPEFLEDDSGVDVRERQAVLKGIIEGLAYSIQFNESNKAILANLRDEDTGQNLTASYSDFYSVADQEIPQRVQIKSESGSKNVFLRLNYNQIVLNEVVDFPFSVPKRFTVIN